MTVSQSPKEDLWILALSTGLLITDCDVPVFMVLLSNLLLLDNPVLLFSAGRVWELD